jgi:hypothetical protein
MADAGQPNPPAATDAPASADVVAPAGAGVGAGESGAKRVLAKTAPEIRVPAGAMKTILVGLAVSMPAAALLNAGVLSLANNSDYWRGFLPAAVIAVVAAALSLIPLCWALLVGGKAERVMGMFVLAGVVRMAVSVLLGLLATKHFGYPQGPTLLMVVSYYFAVLAVEAVVLGKMFWTARPAEPAAPSAAA